MASSIWDTSNFYTHLNPTTLTKSFELAKASKAIPNAVNACAELQGFVDADDLGCWASNTKQIRPSSSSYSRTGQAGIYRPIKTPFEIRVLHLKPGKGTEKLRGTLHHCSIEFMYEARALIPTSATGPTQQPITSHATCLEDPSQLIWYTALSYTWGAPVFDASIELGGQERPITRSLETALFHLRRPDRSGIIWIDQICINQDDLDEKALQIPLMSRVYDHALNTIIWLGPSQPDFSTNPFDVLEHCATNLQFLEDIDCPNDFESIGIPSADSESWKEAWELLSRPWFKRLWIIQEVIILEDLWVACGNHVVSWHVITDACNRLQASGVSYWLTNRFSDSEHRANNPLDIDVCRTIVYLSATKDRKQDMAKEGLKLYNFLRTLEGTRYALCYDPRDKIYGLLGLGLGKGLDLEVRYDEDYTATDLYSDIGVRTLSMDLLARDNLETVLECVDHDQTKTDLPSWVPDWSQPRRTISIGLGLGGSGMYSASGRLDRTQKKEDHWNPGRWKFSITDFELKNGNKELCVQGRAFDTVTDTTPLLENPDLTLDNPKQYNHALTSCYGLAKLISEYPNGSKNVFEALWNTIVAGKDAPLGLSFNETAWAKAPETFAEIFSLLLDETTGLAPSLPGQTYSDRQKRPRGRGRLELSNLRGRRSAGRTYQSARVAFSRATIKRRFGLTSKGYFGLFPGHICEGDIVCIFRGCHVPFVLRPVKDDKFRLVGECYVHGIMHGEAMGDKLITQREFIVL
ncbi:Heterokaryon incompatibility protein 6, OR allele [Cytospora mali]|uniref:Heterokaryon incompatibility protein 6, OR allele n=1 Tax=Cytospora mali TaxID=578113 RepID=A0A194VYG4_CYTMA|nr:Heterokaryon incompatibility protein 6, OR allele [Valsa mali]